MQEYNRLVQGLQGNVGKNINVDFLANPIIEKDWSNIAIPGNIWKAEHFLATAWNIVTYLDKQLSSKEVKV